MILMRRAKLWAAPTPYQAPVPQVEKIIPRLNFIVKEEHRKLSRPDGPAGRLRRLRAMVTALLKYERLELNAEPGHEARGYAERVIAEALRNSDCHRPTMDLLDYWITEKQLIHKLFKVLVPRYQDMKSPYTRVFTAPTILKRNVEFSRVILELKGNPYPPVIVDIVAPENQLHNILLEEARLEFDRQQNELNKGVSVQKERVDNTGEQNDMTSSLDLDNSLTKPTYGTPHWERTRR